MVLKHILLHIRESKRHLELAKRRIHELTEQKRLHAHKIRKIDEEITRLHQNAKKLEEYLRKIRYA